MGEAIFGFLGVLLGGLITWGIERSRVRRRDRRAALVGVRLISSELRTAADLMDVERQHDAVWRPIWRAAETPAWSEHRAAVASVATREEWATISVGFDNVRIVRTVAEGSEARIDEQGRKSLRAASGAARDGADVLDVIEKRLKLVPGSRPWRCRS